MTPEIIPPERRPPPRSLRRAYLLLLLVGSFGAHRFYLGRPASGVAMAGLGVAEILLTTPHLAPGAALLPENAALEVLVSAALFLWTAIDAAFLPRWVHRLGAPG